MKSVQSANGTSSTVIDAGTVRAIETVLSKGDRVEVIPVKDGVRVMRIRRETVKVATEKTEKRTDV